MSEDSVREKERYEAREREKRLLGNRGKEKQLTLKLDNRSSDRLLRIESELSAYEVFALSCAHSLLSIHCYMCYALELGKPKILPKTAQRS